ncbi:MULTISPECIES: hypothetical protein [Leptolyngbya]|uniref:hypothetical protein n=1 Tax=Leptolyngbya TaxID=47251 RepID=UPI0016831DBB|nr:hypothetical protein [Leptolyngbya sp. FACHB-1624]MBD1855415.1 hypothetical protein [Leptolyngbya sp. FACHB-1624]
MQRKNCLILNFAIVSLITILLIRDRSINELFQVSLDQKTQSSITLPGYQLDCQQADTLYCKVNLANSPLIIENPSNSNCKATYGKQVLPCYRVQASAFDTLYIKNLYLSQQQQAMINLQIRMRAIASLRILENGVENGIFLLAMLTLLSILSGINAVEAFRAWCHQHYPQHRQFQVLAAMIGGIAIPVLLSFYFFQLLITFGYVG